MTPADHAAKIRDGLYGEWPLAGDDGALALLDALVAQAETAEELRKQTEWQAEELDAVEDARDAAVQAAEHAREALRQVELLAPGTHAEAVARAALAGNTE